MPRFANSGLNKRAGRARHERAGQDLLARWGGPLNYGDLIYVEGVGFKFVNDVMNARWKRRADVWVTDYNAEKKFGVRCGRIWLIKKAEQ